MSYKNPRINDGNMTVFDVIKVMCGGNPGAMSVCAQLLENVSKIDPMSAIGGLGAIMMLDTMDIYESRIWMFYKDVCHEDLGVMCAVMRAYQLGQLEGCTLETINHAIDNYGKGLDLKKIVDAVQKQLPSFNANGWKA